MAWQECNQQICCTAKSEEAHISIQCPVKILCWSARKPQREAIHRLKDTEIFTWQQFSFGCKDIFQEHAHKNIWV